jgi:rhodanese-related sulfurtransferase
MEANFDITAAQLKDLLEGDQCIQLLDVRNPDEFEEDNLGGTLIPLGDLPDELDQLESWKGKDIYIHCRSGARSARAKEFLLAEGFENVHNVLGGIMAYREL